MTLALPPLRTRTEVTAALRAEWLSCWRCRGAGRDSFDEQSETTGVHLLDAYFVQSPAPPSAKAADCRVSSTRLWLDGDTGAIGRRGDMRRCGSRPRMERRLVLADLGGYPVCDWIGEISVTVTASISEVCRVSLLHRSLLRGGRARPDGGRSLLPEDDGVDLTRPRNAYRIPERDKYGLRGEVSTGPFSGPPFFRRSGRRADVGSRFAPVCTAACASSPEGRENRFPHS